MLLQYFRKLLGKVANVFLTINHNNYQIVLLFNAT